MHRGARLGALAHALERLVILVFQQRIETGREIFIVQQVAAEDRQQTRLGQERRQREEHEMALRALPAPAVGRLGPQDLEVAVAAGECIEIRRELGERARHRQLRIRTQQRAVVEVGGHMLMQPVAQQGFEGVALAPLVVHQLAFVFQRGSGRRTLVGEGYAVVAVQDGGRGKDRRIHRRHRDVAVPRTQSIELEQARRQLALDVERGQAGTLGASGDQRRIADPHRGRFATDGFDGFHRDQRILATADRHQRAMRQAERLGLGFRGTTAREANATAQVQAVAVSELGQTVQVQRIQQIRRGVVQRTTGHFDARRHASLVVADTRDQVQQLQRFIEGGLMTGGDRRRMRESHPLDQLIAMVERVHQLGHAVGVAAAHEAEYLGQAGVDVGRHSQVSAGITPSPLRATRR